LHADAMLMAQRMDDVLESDEHKMIMREGAEMGYTMPDADAIRARNKILKLYLAASHPWQGAHEKDGMISFPAESARNLYMVAVQSALMIDDVCRNIRESEYMLWFRRLRELEAPYIGPTSLQEMFNVWGALTISTVQQEQYAPQRHRRLPENWMALVV
jgi:hypothetical protein